MCIYIKLAKLQEKSIILSQPNEIQLSVGLGLALNTTQPVWANEGYAQCLIHRSLKTCLAHKVDYCSWTLDSATWPGLEHF